jgi:hypothetical protein
MMHYEFQFLDMCSRSRGLRFFGSTLFPNINGPSATSEGLASAPSSAASEGLASVGTEGPASNAACVVPASADLFIISPSALGASAEAGVNAFVDSITASSTLAILLFGVVTGIFDAFGSSILCNGLRAFGCSIDFFDYGSSVGFALASIGPGQWDSDAQEDPSISFGTSAISMCLGR